jgi:hypothetical protein
VWVRLWNDGASFRMWALASTTVAALRCEASRFWHLSPGDTLLQDHEGAVWPDGARVHEALALARAEGVAGGFGEEEEGEEGEGAAAATAQRRKPPLFRLRLRDALAERVMETAGFTTSGRGDAAGGDAFVAAAAAAAAAAAVAAAASVARTAAAAERSRCSSLR